MLKIDSYYKIVASTFGVAYFIGIVIALIYILRGFTFPVTGTGFINNLSLTSTIYFKNMLYKFAGDSINMALIPFSYLVIAIKYGYAHTALLTSSFLGQIKLLVQLIPVSFFFITDIIFSTLVIKIILVLIKGTANLFLEKRNQIRTKFFTIQDITLFYIGLLSLVVGTIIQTQLLKKLFIFFINVRSVTYILLIVIYIMLIALSQYTTYTTIKELINKFKLK